MRNNYAISNVMIFEYQTKIGLVCNISSPREHVSKIVSLRILILFVFDFNFNYRMLTNITNNTEVSPHLLWHDSISSTLTIGTPIVSLISSTCCLVVLNTHLKMLHNTFKTLLNIILIHNIILFAINISISIYILNYHDQSFIVCSIRHLTVAVPGYFIAFGIVLMSFLRYHIAWKIANQESTKNTIKYMIVLVILFLIFEYFNNGPLTFIAVIFFDMSTATSKCAGTANPGLPIFPIYHFTIVTLISIIGIRYDYLMIKFLKKRNTHKEPGQAKLVPWKSGGEQYDYLIPVSATLTSMTIELISIILMAFLVKGHIENKLVSWKITSIVFFCCGSIVMPIMILLTIRANKKKKVAPIIPKGPMYHDDNKSFEEAIEMRDIPADNENSQDDEFMSENSEVYPVPKIIHVKPIIHHSMESLECHI